MELIRLIREEKGGGGGNHKDTDIHTYTDRYIDIDRDRQKYIETDRQTRQDKTRQDKTRQDKTRQGKARERDRQTDRQTDRQNAEQQSKYVLVLQKRLIQMFTLGVCQGLPGRLDSYNTL